MNSQHVRGTPGLFVSRSGNCGIAVTLSLDSRYFELLERSPVVAQLFAETIVFFAKHSASVGVESVGGVARELPSAPCWTGKVASALLGVVTGAFVLRRHSVGRVVFWNPVADYYQIGIRSGAERLGRGTEKEIRR